MSALLANPKKKRWRLLRTVLLAFAALLAAFISFVACESWTPSGKRPGGVRLERIKASEHYRQDRFVDLIPRQEPEFLPTLARWIQGAPNTTPRAPVPLMKRDKESFANPSANGLRITWLGHSTVLIEIDGEVLLLDPVWSDRCSPVSFYGPTRFHPPPLALDALPRLSAVVISHDHYDHLDYETVVALNRRGTRFVVPLGVGSHLEYWGVAKERIVELEWWQNVKLGQVELIATPARHFSGRSLLMVDRDQTLWAGWAFVGAKHRVFYSGDTAMFPGFSEIGARLGPFDATLIEVGAYNQLWADVHLGPEQALIAHQMVRGQLMIPVHWGTFDLALHAWTEPMERLMVGARSAGVALATPKPGESIEPSQPPAPARWWPQLPWQTASQAPVKSSGI